MDGSIGQMMQRNFGYLSADMTLYGASFRWNYDFPRRRWPCTYRAIGARQFRRRQPFRLCPDRFRRRILIQITQSDMEENIIECRNLTHY